MEHHLLGMAWGHGGRAPLALQTPHSNIRGTVRMKGSLDPGAQVRGSSYLDLKVIPEPLTTMP